MVRIGKRIDQVPSQERLTTLRPDGMAVDPSSGELSWTPTADQIGEHRVSLVASNSAASATQDFVITVEGSGSNNTSRLWALPDRIFSCTV
jgi:hypothetical protein